ncbi:MAG: phage minor capsid protein [Faecalibacterium sp.]
MLTPDYLDTLPDALVALWQQVEEDILRDAARRIGKLGEVTETAAWQLWRFEQIQALRQDVIRTLAKYTGKSNAEIRRLLEQAASDALAADDAIYRSVGKGPTPVNDSPTLMNLLNAGYAQTAGEWENLTATTANTVTRQFEDALDRAWLQVSSGAFDYKTAVRKAVGGLAERMDGVTYPSGHHDTLEVAVRRAVLTGVNQTAGKLQIARMDEMDCEFVETTAHAGARPEHAVWQGKVFHRGGAVTYRGKRYEDFETATGYGTGPGLCGWNCRHGFWPFYPGLSEPNYTADELAALNEKCIEYNGQKYTKYEISQMQRAAERNVRRWKKRYLAEDAAGLDTTKSALRLKAARQSLAQFVRDTGGQNDSSRTSVAGFGRSAASRAAWEARKMRSKSPPEHPSHPLQ